MTQCERILRHLREVGSITAAEAMDEYGVHRLAARISDLRRQGVKITKETARGKNRYGEMTRFAKYKLEE
jgi:hypothetical protein